MNFPFNENPKVAVFTCCHVIEKNNPVLYVTHDSEDGAWQFLCGGAHQEKDAMIISLQEIYKREPSLGVLAGLPPGYLAERNCVKERWTVRKK